LERGLKLKAQGKKFTAKTPWLILFKCSGASEEGFQAWEEKMKEELVRRGYKGRDLEELLKG
jgi:surfactin synthase thioesterase subunit